MAARSADQILADWQAATLVSDDTADVQKGPLYSLVGYPLAQVLAPTEAEADQLAQIYSIQFAENATAAQAQAFLTNWSEAPGTGSPSKTRVFFMRFSAPLSTDVITIPQGTIVSNSDQTLQYVTVESGTMNGAYATTYFNPTRRTYEIPLNVAAVQNGPQYDLPAGRINTFVTQVQGIDALENREAATGGVAAETTYQQINRVQQKLQGLAINTAAGEKTRIQTYNPSLVQDVNIVLSNNRILFQRPTFEPGNDYYILGSDYVTAVQTYTSVVGGETQIPLQYVPALSIGQVLLNNVAITGWYLQKDTSLAYGGSAVSQDKLILATALMANDVLQITTTYNQLIQGVQTDVFGQTTLWKTNELARQFFPVYPQIVMSGKALPSYDPTQVQNDCYAQLQAILAPGYWQQEYLPDIVLQEMKTNVQGLTNPSFTVFQRLTGATSTIQAIVVAQNEIVTYNPTYITVTIRGT